jgi:hypothetical protein
VVLIAHKYYKFIKPNKSLAGTYAVTCGVALISSSVLLRMNRVPTPQFFYLLPLVVMLLWSLYYFFTGKSTALKLLEYVDGSSPISAPSARLQFLRELRDSGQISEMEYQELRQRVLEQLAGL